MMNKHALYEYMSSSSDRLIILNKPHLVPTPVECVPTVKSQTNDLCHIYIQIVINPHADHRGGISRVPVQINNYPACIITKSYCR